MLHSLSIQWQRRQSKFSDQVEVGLLRKGSMHDFAKKKKKEADCVTQAAKR